jgi:hypothetical protein
MIIVVPVSFPVLPRSLVVLAGRPVPFERLARRTRRRRALDQFVQLAAVQPDAAALRAVVDLHSLAVRHPQFHVTNRALHGFLFRSALGSLLSGSSCLS